MAKDLIIGGSNGYDWNTLKYWVCSIKETGFKGDIVLVATNITKDTITKLQEYGVRVAAYGASTDNGFAALPSKLAPHVERFLYIWSFLNQNRDRYRFVVITDTRDVIFQRDPTLFLEKSLVTKSLVCSAEGMLYKDEPWGSRNLLETFGPFFYEHYKEWPIYNVGTIAGYAEEMEDFLNVLFQLSSTRPIPIVDQAVFNYLINMHPYKDDCLKTSGNSEWASQLACTRKAIEAGSGDIGAAGDLEKYDRVFQGVQPEIVGPEVWVPKGPKYIIVHQWDRIPSLKAEIEKKYGNY